MLVEAQQRMKARLLPSPSSPSSLLSSHKQVEKNTFLRQPLRTLLFSATLAQHSAQFAALQLDAPILFYPLSKSKQSLPTPTTEADKVEQTIINASGTDHSSVKFTLPPNLHQYMTTSLEQNKVLSLLYILFMWFSGRLNESLGKRKKSQAANQKDKKDSKDTSEHSSSQVLIFTNSVETPHRVSLFLNKWGTLDDTITSDNEENKDRTSDTKDNTEDSATKKNAFPLKSVWLHSYLNDRARTDILEQFNRGAANIMITTDLGGRGLDFSTVGLVINYDLPRRSEDYVHRVGRTARAGLNGDAITIISPSQRVKFETMMKSIQHGFHAVDMVFSPKQWNDSLLTKKDDTLTELEKELSKENDSQGRKKYSSKK